MPIKEELDRQLADAVRRDPIRALVEIAGLKAVIAAREREAVLAAIACHTWQSVGEALGVSRQAVFQRFGREWLERRRAAVSAREWREEARRTLRRR